MNTKTKSLLKYIVLFIIAGLLVWLAIYNVSDNKDEIIKAFEQADYFWIFISSLFALLGHCLRAYRWNYLLKPLGYKSKLINSIGAVFIGYLVNYAAPRVGELSRCTVVAKYDKIPFEKALGTVITERLVDFVLLILVFILTLLLQFGELYGLSDKYIFSPFKEKMHVFIDKPVLGIAVITIIVIGFAGLFILRKKISALLTGKFGKIIKGFGEGLSSIKQTKGKFSFSLLSLGIWTTYLLGIYFALFAFKETTHLGLKESLVLLLFGTFGVIFAPSGGLGAYQLILTAVLGFYLIPEGSAAALPWVIWSTQFLVVVLVGLISFAVLPLYNRNKNVAQQ